MKSSLRLKLIYWGMFGGLAVLTLGLFQTQVIRGGYHRKASEQNRIRLIRLEAPRGAIYDRNGVLLAANRPSYHVYVIPEDFDPKHLPLLTALLHLSESEIRKRIARSRETPFSPALVKRDITKETAMQIEEHRPRLAGVFIQVQAIRTYPKRETSAHTVGYISKISRTEFERLDRSVYHLNSWIGRSGVERAFDAQLRGEDGGRQIEVDARGEPIRVLGEKEPAPGSDLYLALDSEFEERILPLIRERRGAILAMDLRTGELLTALSSPGFDPNAFVMPSRSDERLGLIGSDSRPLVDRAFDGLYPPGSVFKLVTAMAALESGIITPHTTFHCPGYFKLSPGSRRFDCWFAEGHGRVNLLTAIERSCNVYFYNVGRLAGEKRIASYARKLGFGSPAGLELPTSSGLVPDSDWKQKKYHDRWYAGETISFAIGQSYLLVTPIQILRLIAAVATDGSVFAPSLVRPAGEKKLSQGESALSIRPETFRILRKGMLQAVSSDKGTGQLARVDFARLAAKTGTAQSPPGAAHAWFGGFFPYEHPEIALVVFVERGESGGITAAKIAKQAARAWNELSILRVGKANAPALA